MSKQETSTAKNTPGPLRTKIGLEGGLFVRDADDRLIAGFQTASRNRLIAEGEGEANAALFIAAPILLEALKKLRTQHARWAGFMEWQGEDTTVLAEASAALKAAEGQQ